MVLVVPFDFASISVQSRALMRVEVIPQYAYRRQGGALPVPNGSVELWIVVPSNQTDTPPVFQVSPGHVSWPGSPGPGIV
jgi:hypothetical protein